MLLAERLNKAIKNLSLVELLALVIKWSSRYVMKPAPVITSKAQIAKSLLRFLLFAGTNGLLCIRPVLHNQL